MRLVNPVVLRSAALLLVTCGTVGAFAANWESPVRTAVALAFLLFVPGLAVVEMLGVRETLHRWALATGVSLALETAAGLVLLYAGAFSPGRALSIVASVTIVAIGIALGRARRTAA